ncbi:hypothetical protein Pcinc_040287 [Petrolisthes cinctipes]|uniref:Uncharacterized protein n=1 Tax=Petrolisthes cinctipes TaxID=88211 RepID=A0AAE1BLX6_PETCI|nr:hypothetical protein Pcinc_040287 [Petrolisthes cinctipes]
MYCTVILSEVPIVCAVEKPSGLWVIQDITLKRQQGTSAGILLRHADEGTQMVESVQQNSPAQTAGLRKNDILLAVNGTYLNSGQQAAKLFSTNNINGDNNSITVRVKRLVQPDPRKVVAEHKTIGSDGSAAVVGEDTSGRPLVTYSGQPSVAACINNSSFSGDKNSSSAWIDSSTNSNASGYIGNSDGGGVTRTVSPTHLLAGLMGNLNGVRPARHRSLPGSPVLQRTSRNRINSTRDGDMSGSGKSTPDSSHNNSPELKRKLLDLHSFPTTTTNNPANNTTTTTTTQDKSPVFSSSSTLGGKGLHQQHQKNVVVVGTCQEKSTGSSIGGQNSSTSINEKTQSNQSSKAGTPTSPEIMLALNAAEKRGLRRHTVKNKMHLKILQTPFVDGSCDPVFDSDFEFWLEDENKYMSIAVWSRNISSCKPEFDAFPGDNKQQQHQQHNNKDTTTTTRDKSSRPKESGERDHRRRSRESDRYSKTPDDVTCGLSDDTLVAYMNLALITLIPDTTLTTQGHVTKLATLTSPHPKCPEMATDSLMSHKGFNPNLCYGDMTLSLTYQPQDRCEALGRGIIDRSTHSEDESMTDGTISEEDDIIGLQETTIGEDRSHEFKRTHFHSATQCDFCKKKIWLKDAYQCSECGIICHKKCMVKCEQQTSCDAGGVRYRTTTTTTTTTTDNNTNTTTTKDMPPEIITTTAVLAANTESHSPVNTPPASPQVSIWEGSNPFVVEWDDGDTIQGALDRLLLLPHDERLVTMARDSARDLHSLLPTHQRITKINQTLTQLQSSIDSEGEVRMDLARQERDASDANDSLTRASVALQISQCDARTQALALLTLHYCTALQYCNAQPQDDGNDNKESNNSSLPVNPNTNNTRITKQEHEG